MMIVIVAQSLWRPSLPMIDLHAAIGTFPDAAQLAKDLAAAVMAVEGVPNIPMFRNNTAAFVHELPATALANVDGDSTYVRVVGWPGEVSPPGSHRTVRDSLPSHGSYHPVGRKSRVQDQWANPRG
jgi:hypothetical protein